MITLNSIELPDLLWTDEYAWNPVVGDIAYTVSGALIVEESVMQSGRPITLASTESGGWTTKAVVDALRQLSLATGNTLALNLHGTTRTVIWKRSGNSVEAEPVVAYSDPSPDTRYRITLRLLEVG